MSRSKIAPTGKEIFFSDDEFIVSKTDLTGRIAYANQVFCRVSGYTESELLGKPHSLIRHPEMPRCVFKLLWDTIASGKEIFAYVVNLCKNGDHYWVFAHVTPTFDQSGNLVGYHSNRRVPNRAVLDEIRSLYAALLKEEAAHADKRQGMQNGVQYLLRILEEQNVSYDEFVFSTVQC